MVRITACEISRLHFYGSRNTLVALGAILKTSQLQARVREEVTTAHHLKDNELLDELTILPVSTTIHLYSQKAQFSRAISMGGTALLLKPVPYFVHDMTYQAVLKHLGITADTAEERVQALLKMPAAEIGAKLPPGLPLFPAIDNDLIPAPAEFSGIADPESPALPGRTWCKALFIGDNQLDVRFGYYPSHDIHS
jgi:hypothetical protein